MYINLPVSITFPNAEVHNHLNFFHFGKNSGEKLMVSHGDFHKKIRDNTQKPQFEPNNRNFALYNIAIE